MPRQEALFPDAGGLPPWTPGRPGDPTAAATFMMDADQLAVGDYLAVLGRLEKVTGIVIDKQGNLRVRTPRTGKGSGYFKFPSDKVRIVPRRRGASWQG